MVSSVDFFGLICGLAQATYTSGGVPTWQNANPQLTTRMDMIKCLESNSYTTSGRTISIGGVETPYIFHTYNEWFKINSTDTPRDPDDPCHVLCLRTAGQKLVYYDTWATGSSPQQSKFTAEDFDTTSSSYATDWTTANAEYYVSDPAETGNSFETSTIHDIQANFMGCVTSELQVSPGSSFATAQSGAVTAFRTYITAPVVTGVTNSSGGSTITHSASAQTIYINASGVVAGPTIVITPPSGSIPPFLIDDSVTSLSSIALTVTLVHTGSYSVNLQNPSGLYSTLNFTVS
jgi:hypothetical protein